MICPECGNKKTRVIDTRETSDHQTKRRRECPKCSRKFTTYEKAICRFKTAEDLSYRGNTA